MFRKVLLIIAAMTFLPALLLAHNTTDKGKPVDTLFDADIGYGAGGPPVTVPLRTLSKDTVYVLRGYVYVEEGSEIVIPPGTIIKGDTARLGGIEASALIISRGGKINAQGTKDEPIIFTTIADSVWDPYDIDLLTFSEARRRWGGVILLGRGTTNQPGGVDSIEGIVGDVWHRNRYGDSTAAQAVKDNDSSGVMKYVSIRHGGEVIGVGNEINGLTMGALGCRTHLSYIESAFNVDDGFEHFGGCQKTDHMVAAFGADDGFDWDEGCRLTGQFWFVIYDTLYDPTMYCSEMDGVDVSPGGDFPYATPIVSNVTYFGQGKNTHANDCMLFRENTGGAYYNSIFADCGGSLARVAASGLPSNSYRRMTQAPYADLKLYANTVWDMGFFDGTFQSLVHDTPNVSVNHEDTMADLMFDANILPAWPPGQPSVAWRNEYANPGVMSGSRLPFTHDLDPRPSGTSTWYNPRDVDTAIGFYPELPPTIPPDTIRIPACYDDFQVVNYRGAFSPDSALWIYGWTALYDYGYLVPCCSGTRGDVNGSGTISIPDVTYLMAYLKSIGPAPTCFEEGDVNGSGTISIPDVTYLMAYLKSIGPAPPACP
jgi:hypothetical protein